MASAEHVDYPHEPGTLYDCPPCEEIMAQEELEDNTDHYNYG